MRPSDQILADTAEFMSPTGQPAAMNSVPKGPGSFFVSKKQG